MNESSLQISNYYLIDIIRKNFYFNIYLLFFLGISFKYPNDVHSQLYCSTCRLASKGSVQVFSGITSCPENWDYIYDGLLMSGLKDLLGTSTVCLDKTSEQDTKFLSENSIVPNWALHANNHEKHMLFPCVVCSK